MIELQDFYKDLNYGMFGDVENYNEIQALNCSSLKNGEMTSLHVDKALQGILKPKKKEFEFGSEFHYYLFEPELFNQKYYFSDKHLGYKTNVDKAERLKEKVFKNGKTRIDLYEAEKIKKGVEALYRHPSIRKLIETKGVIEQTLIWKDSDFGLNCKGRLDKIIPHDFIIDLKTTKNASELHFSKDFRHFQYGVQAAFYLDGYKEIFGKELNIEFAFIAIDKEEPFLPELYQVSDKTITDSRTKYKKYIEKYISYKNDPESIYSVKTL